MAKPRGRPKGSGYPEDEPILREAIRAMLAESITPHAAAERFADSVPGPSHDSRKRRLYDKLLERRVELEKEVLADEAEDLGISDEEWETLWKIGQDLVDEKSLDEKLARLAAIFRTAAEIESLKSDLIRLLQEDGLELSSNLRRKLNIILYAYRTFSQSMGRYTERGKIRRFRRKLELAEKTEEAEQGLQVNSEEKKPDSSG
jgi:hypothetical protein